VIERIKGMINAGGKTLPRLQVSSIDLSEDEIDWIRAICNVSGISVRAQVAQIIQGHLVRFKPHYKKKIAYVARKYGLTFEEAFALLQTQSPPLGDVVNPAPVREEEEVSTFGCEAVNSSAQPKDTQNALAEEDNANQ
jgi:hypothetical protein